MKGKIIVGVALVLAHAVRAEEGVPTGRVFYAPFDGELDAAEARGKTTAKPVGNPSFVPGHRGQGLLVGDVDDSTGAMFETAGNFSLERGTVALWVKPLNWKGDDPVFSLFFHTKTSEGGSFIFYKYTNASWGLTFYVHPDRGPRTKTYCYKPVSEWQPGQWHHIACAWTRHEGMAIYIDGEQVRYLGGVSMADGTPSSHMTFGGTWQRKGNRTVLDEAMVFDRMLAPHEIAGLAGKPRQPLPVSEARDIPGVALAHAVLGQRVLARVYRDALGDVPINSAVLSVHAKTSDEVTARTRIALDKPLTQLELDITTVPHGHYEAKLALLSGAETKALESLEFSKETDDTWETAASIGKADIVLPPFTPLAVAGRQVSSFGRTYEFGGSGLPRRLVSQSAELLAGPVRVAAESSEGPIGFEPGKLRVISESPTQAELSGAMGSDSLKIQVNVLCRYDGTAWSTLHVHPLDPIDLSRLRVEIPIAPDQARYLAYINLARVDGKRLGYDALPQGDGVVWSREFLPSLWIGTEERGLGWYAESDEHWDSEGEGALTVERSEGRALLCLNIVRKPRRIAQDFTIEFGLQATPVQPLAPDWRALQWIPSTDITRFFLHLRKNPYPRPELAGKRPRGKVSYLYTYHPYFTSTLPKDPGEFREMVQRVKDRGLFGVPYTDVNFIPENFGDVWMMRNAMHATPGARACGYGRMCNIATCHRSRFADWFVWYVSHLVKNYGLNGLYMDEVWSYGCADPSHGCGYEGSDGRRRLTHPLRAQNELYRRIRTVFAETDRPFHITFHISGGRLAPIATFADSFLLGEDRYHSVRKTPDYTENMTAAQWRAGYLTASWGIPSVLLPQFKMRGDWMKSEDLAEKLMTAAVPHDLMLWPSFAHAETIMKYRSALDAFGIGAPDTRFLPYWRVDTGVTCDDARVKISAYVRPGKVLLCVANWSSEELRDLRIRITPSRLKLSANMSARDAVTDRSLVIDGDRLAMSMPAKRLRLIEIE